MTPILEKSPFYTRSLYVPELIEGVEGIVALGYTVTIENIEGDNYVAVHEDQIGPRAMLLISKLCYESLLYPFAVSEFGLGVKILFQIKRDAYAK